MVNTPQHDPLAERGVLGSMMLEPRAAALACELLTGQDFYIKPYRELFNLLAARVERGERTDELLVRDDLERDGLLTEIGGFKFLGDLIAATPNAGHVEEYAQILRRKSTLRALEQACLTCLESLHENGRDAEELLSEAREQFAAIPRPDLRCGPIPAELLDARLEAAISGQRRAMILGGPKLTEATRALLPGTVTILYGRDGSTKTLFVLAALARWIDAKVGVAVLELEENLAHHLARVLAQKVGNSGLTEDDWCENHGSEVREAQQMHKAFLNQIGSTITPPFERPTAARICSWVQARVNDGMRIVVVDPITAKEDAAKVWLQDAEITRKLKRSIEDSGSSVLLVSHTAKYTDNLAGGAAYERFVQTRLRIEKLPEPKTAMFDGEMGHVEREYRVIVHIEKARNSWGDGMRIAYGFDPATLRHEERGLLRKEKAE